MKKDMLKRTLKTGLAVALIGAMTVSSVACSVSAPKQEEQTISTQFETVVTPQEQTVIETIKVAEPADMLEVESTPSEEITENFKPITLSAFSEEVTTINENGEEETTYKKVITANITPEEVTNVLFSWNVEWETNNEGANAVVTDYLTIEPLSGTFNKAVIVAHKMFPNSTIKVTATAKGTDITGSCIVSFVGLPTEIKLTYYTTKNDTITKLFDEDWQTEIYNLDKGTNFTFEFDNPFHYIQENYTPNFTFNAELKGAYGLNITKLYGEGIKDPSFTPLYGEFSIEKGYRESEPDVFNLNTSILPTLQQMFGVNTEFAFTDSITVGLGTNMEGADYNQSVNSWNSNIGFITTNDVFAIIGGSKPVISLNGDTDYSYGGYLRVYNIESQTNDYYIVEQCYRDNKLPYIEFSISTGNATKKINVRFGQKITGVDVNNGSVVL